jgi:arabinofuranosyltransferase
MSTSRIDRRVASLLWLFLFVVILRNAWLCEDAYITYRVVDNFVHGYGLRWNTLERVQVYTHPLWMMALVPFHAISRDAYFSAMFLSLGCSAFAVYLLLFRAMRTTWQCVLAAAVAVFSKGFIDFSTGGLENPLSHVLLGLFFLAYLREGPRKIERMILFASLALVNRLDLVWIVLPALVDQVRSDRAWHPTKLKVWLGLSPLVLWEIFATFYYGFAFPNSAYAKLTVQIKSIDFLRQGVLYYVNSIAWDPVTLTAIAACCIYALLRWRDEKRFACLALGVFLYLAYIIRVGGDYMSGRFFTAPLFVSLFVISGVDLEEGVFAPVVALVGVLGLGLASPRPPVFSNDSYQGLGSAPMSIDDERGYRFGDTSILLLNRDHGLQNRGGWVGDGIKARDNHTRVTVYKNIGYFGYFAGPTVHVIDPYGIGDPLMGRMPFGEQNGGWSSGHFYRKVPEGYEHAAIDDGSIRNPVLQAYWEKLKLLTRGRLFDPARLSLVFRFNLGLERAPSEEQLSAAEGHSPPPAAPPLPGPHP